jgi:hypothetical protein
MRINGDISDLFFNTDHNSAEYDSNKRFVGYNHDKLREAAELFLLSLERLGVAVPTVDELTADFYGRI